MPMTRKGKKITSVAALVLLVVLVVVANVWRRQSLVRDIRVEIDYCDAEALVTASQVRQSVHRQMPKIMATRLRDVDLRAVERAARKCPYLRNCEATTSISGAVVLYAMQRRPIVHVCTDDREYYLDDGADSNKYACLPMSGSGACDVVVASGRIPANSKAEKAVWTLAKYLDQHPDLLPLFDQIYCHEDGDLYLTPKLGAHVVQVGSAENLDQKFHDLVALYTRGLSQAGWDTYSQVSVKYRGQVVCTKRNK